MGMAAAYDFKLYLPMLCLGFLGLTAACKFRGLAASGGEQAPAPSFAGG